ncbi:hypothetical protein VCHA49P381_40048 [Vibrio chagasii]|nr:hypothetical protein VCHA49P381_40048 [Vibrio chagasii]
MYQGTHHAHVEVGQNSERAVEKLYNKQFKNDSQHMAFLPCVG